MAKQWTPEERKAFGENSFKTKTISLKLNTTEYRTIHYWAERTFGKPNNCDKCKTTAPRRYHWANISGQYTKDKADWQRLCVPCHKKLDVKPYRVVGSICKRGHILTEDNVYRRNNRPDIECRACVLSRMKKIKELQYV